MMPSLLLPLSKNVMQRSEAPEESTSPAEEPQPVPAVAAAPLAADASRVVSGPALRNAMSLVTVAWIFGNVWYVTVTGAPFALFTLAMKPSPFEIGLLSAIPYMAALLSIPASLLIERTGARKTIFFYGLYLQRGLWLFLGLVPLWIVSRYGVEAAPMALWFFIPAFFIMHAGNAVGGPAWVSWMADVVPHRTRGKYFARRRMWALLLAIPAAWFVGWLLDEYARGQGTIVTMRWCAMIFVAAGIFGLLDIAAFHRVPTVPQAPRTGAGLIKAMAGPLKDKQYLWFAGYVAILMFAVVPIQQQFYQFYLIDKIGLQNKSVQVMMLVLPSLVQLLLIPVWGRAADRMGKRPLLIMATLGLVPIGLGWCFVDKDTAWLGYLLSALGIALWSGVDLVNFNFVIEMSSSRGKKKDGQPRIGGTAYHAVNSVILNIAALTGGLAWGAIAQWLKDWHWTIPGWKTLGSYDVLFILSGILRLAAVVIFLPKIIEPAARPTFEAMRFMGANIYNNVTNVILGPLRLMRSRRLHRRHR